MTLLRHHPFMLGFRVGEQRNVLLLRKVEAKRR